MSLQRRVDVVFPLVGAALLLAIAGCTSSPPPPNTIHSATSSALAPSGCTSPNLELVVPGAGKAELQTCTDGRITDYDVVATVRPGTVLRIDANSSQPSKTMGSVNYDGHGGLLAAPRVASTHWDTTTYHDTITALHPGTTSVRGYGPTYCLSYRSTAIPTPESSNSTTPNCHLFTLVVNE